MFLEEISICMTGLSKVVYLLQCSQHLAICGRPPKLNKKVEKGRIWSLFFFFFFLPFCLSWDTDLLSCWLPFIKFLDSVWIISLTFLGIQLQMAIMGLVSLHNCVSQFLIIDPFMYLYTNIYVCIYKLYLYIYASIFVCIFISIFY